MRKSFYYLPVLLLLIPACKEGGLRPDICPHSSFTAAFPKRPVNLIRRLGDSLRLEIAETDYEQRQPAVSDSRKADTASQNAAYKPEIRIDTEKYRIDYDRKTKMNTVTRLPHRDTVFYGLVSVYRGLYYFSMPIDDSTFWIGAVNIGMDSIQGLGFLWSQMCALEGYMHQHPNSSLILSANTSRDEFRLKPDKKILKEIYPGLVAPCPKYKIISDQVEYKEDSWAPIEKKLKAESQYRKVENTIAESVYPVPASDFIDIDFTNSGNYTVQLIDNSGRIILSRKVSGKFSELAINGFRPGFCILRVYAPDDKMMETHRVIIK